MKRTRFTEEQIIGVLKEAEVGAKREAVAHLQTCHGMSERRACRVVDADRKSVRYRATRDDDAGLRDKLRELALAEG